MGWGTVFFLNSELFYFSFCYLCILLEFLRYIFDELLIVFKGGVRRTVGMEKRTDGDTTE